MQSKNLVGIPSDPLARTPYHNRITQNILRPRPKANVQIGAYQVSIIPSPICELRWPAKP